MDPLNLGFWWGVLASIIASAIFVSLWPGYKWLSLRAIDAAVRRLPGELQEAMREEWHAELEAYPEGILGLLWALDLRRGAKAMAAELSQGPNKETNKGRTFHVREFLQPEEEIIYISRIHWIYTLRAIGPLAMSITVVFSAWLHGGVLPFLLVLGLSVPFSLGYFLKKMAYKWTCHVVITNKRLILQKGWINRNTMDLSRDRILGHKIAEDAWGKILGYGKFTLVGAGVGEIELPGFISDPVRLHRALKGKV